MPSSTATADKAAPAGKSKPSADLNLAYARFQEQAQPQEARSAYHKVLAENPRSVEAIVGLARVDYMSGRKPEAEARYLEAHKLGPKSPLALTALGQFYTEEGRTSEALPVLQQAVQLAPDDKNARYQFGVALARSGQSDAALLQFQQAVGPAAGHYNLGLILHERGDLPGCQRQFELAEMKDPKLEQARYWLDELRHNREGQLAQAAGSASPPVTSAAYQPRNGGAGVLPAHQSQTAPTGQLNPRISPSPSRQQESFAASRSGESSPLSAPAPSRPTLGSPATTSPNPGAGRPPANATPQQIEQWNNQRSFETASAPR